MEEKLIESKTAFLAKQKGFREKVRNYIKLTTISAKPIEDESSIPQDFNGEFEKQGNIISRPSQSFLQAWLREKHNVDLWFGKLDSPNKYHVEDILQNDVIIGGINTGSATYEEALELGLFQALTLIKILI